MLPLWESSKYEHEHLVPASPCYEKTNEAITIKRAIKAPRTTSRLNLRIRFSYACAQSIRTGTCRGPVRGGNRSLISHTAGLNSPRNPTATTKVAPAKTCLLNSWKSWKKRPGDYD